MMTTLLTSVHHFSA